MSAKSLGSQTRSEVSSKASGHSPCVPGLLPGALGPLGREASAGRLVCGGGGWKAVAGNPASSEVSTTLCSVAAKIPWPLPASTAFRCHHKFGFNERARDKSKPFL